MSLVKTIEQIQEYITVASTFDYDRAAPWIRKAERKYIVPLIGKEDYNYFIENEASEQELESKQIVRKLLEEASINLAFHLGFAQLFKHVSNYGVTTTDLEDTKQVVWSEKRDLHRSYIRDGNEALDEALKEMEFYLDDFPDWRASASFTMLNETFCKHTDDFQKWFNIHNSRRTFLAFKPDIREITEQYFYPWLNTETISQIKTASTNEIILRALELCQKAEVALTIAKITKTGKFEITETGFFLRWETLAYEKKKQIDFKLLDRISSLKQVAGEEYLKKLKIHIEDNLNVFTNYTIENTKQTSSIIKKKSGLAI